MHAHDISRSSFSTVAIRRRGSTFDASRIVELPSYVAGQGNLQNARMKGVSIVEVEGIQMGKRAGARASKMSKFGAHAGARQMFRRLSRGDQCRLTLAVDFGVRLPIVAEFWRVCPRPVSWPDIDAEDAPIVDLDSRIESALAEPPDPKSPTLSA